MALRSFYFLIFEKGALDFYRRRSEPPLRRREGGLMIPRLWNTFCTFHHDPHAIFFLFLLIFPCYDHTTFVQVRHSLYIILQPLGFRATFMSASSFVAASSLHGASLFANFVLVFTILGLLFFFFWQFIFYTLQELTVPGWGIIVSISIRRSKEQVLLRGLGLLFA
ncbi:hypothetical protein V8C42DRAFT_53075 [Trichoderma barbatum]